MCKLLTTLASKRRCPKLFFSTGAQDETENFTERKLDYYRNLEASLKSSTNVDEWKKGKPFRSIPGPKSLPLLGNTWRFFIPKIGDFYGLDFLEIYSKLHKRYGDLAILRGVYYRPMLLLFNPHDIEKLHRHDGAWPLKRAFPSLRRYRHLRKDIIPYGGVVTLDGEDWFKFRTLINPILMQPKNMVQYTGSVANVAQELIDNMRYFSRQNKDGEMPQDFEHELYKWSLESVGVVMMDTHFGVLNRSNKEQSQPAKLANSVLQIFDLIYKLDVMPPIWNFGREKNWNRFVKTLDFALETSLKHINERIEQMEREESDKNTVLCQLIKVDRSIAITWCIEMILAGVDTTAKVLAALLYYLAKNPEKQEQLRREAIALLDHRDSEVTKDVLAKAVYTKAVIKETTRLAAVTVGNLRVTKTDLVLGGYQVPAGTHVHTSCLLLCKKDEHFPKAGEFLPERWLKTTTDELSYKNTHPFVFAPFGYGPRSCLGQRLANLELKTAVLKIIRNFELKWPHEDMVFEAYTLHGIARPLTIQVKDI